MLVWIDLETTGLDPHRDKILEVACVITDDHATEVARLHRVTTEARHHDLSTVSDYVRKMHAKSGLWNESLTADPVGEPDVIIGAVDGVTPSTGADLMHIETALRSFVLRHTGAPNVVAPKLTLAGSSVWFDRGFIRRHMPSVDALLNYRILDVSSVGGFVEREHPNVWANRSQPAEPAHRAMDDIDESMRLYRYFRQHLRSGIPQNYSTENS